ncbi:polysaccharide deacetylase family protein [Actinoallomurus purpureus]|uniref:polysaccharide deacetylase family protein n=1 Tax=Actinoallomurus purpureus TaxID=478114 RepID=UPI002093EAC9|nr:polysaccharide deacetylase family protein [Actinoallomurus purpureus]MCO6009667.1 polysaccharide deacetylase family protein [Actinoallomurus purpureus]
MEFRDVMTRRRMLALGAASAALLLAGDRVKGASAGAPHPLARGRAVIPTQNTSPSPTPTPTPAPPSPTPLPRRKEAVHRVHDVLPDAPPNAISLTIDDGPQPEWTPKMLDLLAEHDVKATFSLIGIQVKQYPKLAQRIVAEGHQLCNHTMNHPLGIASMSSRQVDREITEAHDRICDATGVVPKFFRSPGGAWSRAVFGSAARHGMLPIDWDIDPRDWSRPGTRHIKKSMLAAKGGDILLCHDGGGDRSETIKALGQVLPKLKARGLSFVLL